MRILPPRIPPFLDCVMHDKVTREQVLMDVITILCICIVKYVRAHFPPFTEIAARSRGLGRKMAVSDRSSQ